MVFRQKFLAALLFVLGGYSVDAYAGFYCDVDIGGGQCITLCGTNAAFILENNFLCTGSWNQYGSGNECPPRTLASNPEVRNPSVAMPWRYTKANFEKLLANTTKRRISAMEIKQIYAAEQKRTKGVVLPSK